MIAALFESQSAAGIVSTLAFLVISLGIHEAAHAWVALRCGDTTARDAGRISLNPIVHIDLFMTILLPLFLILSNSPFLFGGAKPVPVAYHRLRHPLRDMMLVALAGPVSNVLLAVVFLVAYKSIYFFEMSGVLDSALPGVLRATVMLNLLLAVFNMFPVPPLDGSRVMTWLLPTSLREPYVALERWGMIIVILLLVVPQLGFRPLLFSGMNAAYQLIDFLTGGPWS
jgi:Zn-dependent protease